MLQYMLYYTFRDLIKGVSMRRMKDLTGQVFGKLTADSFSHKDSGNNAMWLWLCDCGKSKVIRGSEVARGQTKSCGCLVAENTVKRNTKHGMARTRVYKVWISMKTRCYKKDDKYYHLYGGRGISICDRWLTFENFLSDMGEPKRGQSIERRNNNLNYNADNCKWASSKEQQQNKSNSYFWTVGSEVFNSMYDAARVLNINPSTLKGRFDNKNFPEYTKELKYER